MAVKRTKTEKALFNAKKREELAHFNRPNDQLSKDELHQRLLTIQGKIEYETTLIQKFRLDPKLAHLIEGCETRIKDHQRDIDVINLLIES